MIRRTESEIKAYVDGYNACFKQFVEYLDKSIVANQKSVEKMKMLVTAVNNTIGTEENDEL